MADPTIHIFDFSQKVVYADARIKLGHDALLRASYSMNTGKRTRKIQGQGTYDAGITRKLPVRRRQVRDHRAANASLELPLLDLPQAEWCGISQSRPRQSRTFHLA
jgi:hypothetical protein